VGRHALVSGQPLLVTRGVGNSVLPFRHGAQAEVMVCTVHAQAAEGVTSVAT
jgi:predicted MPP superfamily phosphohydrolase